VPPHGPERNRIAAGEPPRGVVGWGALEEDAGPAEAEAEEDHRGADAVEPEVLPRVPSAVPAGRAGVRGRPARRGIRARAAVRAMEDKSLFQI